MVKRAIEKLLIMAAVRGLMQIALLGGLDRYKGITDIGVSV